MREIDDMNEYESSIGDRVYLGTLVLIGFVLGCGIVALIFSCYVKVITGEWPNWI